MSNVRVIDSIGRPHVSPYSPDLRMAAFEAWCAVAGQDAGTVARLLAADPIWREAAGLKPGDPTPDAVTVRRWVRDEDWMLRYQQVMSDLAPTNVRVASLRLINAAPGASATLERICMTDERLTQSDRIKADAARTILSMVIGNNVSELARPVVRETVDFSKLDTIEQIKEAERALQAGDDW